VSPPDAVEAHGTRALEEDRFRVKQHLYEADGYRYGFRVFVPHQRRRSDAALVFLPGRWQNSRLWARADPSRDLRLCAAGQGKLVISIDYRTAFSRRVPGSEITNWRTGDFISDILKALEAATALYSVDRVCLAGFSLGAALAFLVAPRLPSHVALACLAAIDGGLKSPAPRHEHDLGAQLDSRRHLLNENPSWHGVVRRGLLRDLRALQRVRRAGAGRASTVSASEDRLRAALCADRYWPEGQLCEMEALADYRLHPQLHLDRTLESIRVPVLCAMASPSRGPHRALATACATSSSRVDELWCDGWQHLDMLAGADVGHRVNLPTLNWMAENS
jgi:pimeloyl-ACP methyl ester carboxylesterase